MTGHATPLDHNEYLEYWFSVDDLGNGRFLINFTPQGFELLTSNDSASMPEIHKLTQILKDRLVEIEWERSTEEGYEICLWQLGRRQR